MWETPGTVAFLCQLQESVVSVIVHRARFPRSQGAMSSQVLAK